MALDILPRVLGQWIQHPLWNIPACRGLSSGRHGCLDGSRIQPLRQLLQIWWLFPTAKELQPLSSIGVLESFLLAGLIQHSPSAACGTFDEGKLKGDQLEFAYAWDGVSRNNTQRLQPLIAESPANVGIFYRSCMNLTAIEQVMSPKGDQWQRYQVALLGSAKLMMLRWQVGTAPLLPFVKQVEDVKDLVSLTVGRPHSDDASESVASGNCGRVAVLQRTGPEID